MARTVVYDKVSWHFPEGKDCPSLEAAQAHLRVVMDWLLRHGMLSRHGLEVHALGIASDFALSSDLLTPQGRALLDHVYSPWLNTLDYRKPPDTRLLDASLEG